MFLRPFGDPTYGWGILNQQLLEGDVAEQLVSAIKTAPNSVEYFKEHLASELDAAEVQRKSKGKGPIKQPPKRVAKEVRAKITAELPVLDEQPTPKEASAHHRTQDTLKRLGRITGCSVWIASNDKSKEYKGKPLSDGCLQKLPNLGLNEDAISRISLIDVIGFNKVHRFALLRLKQPPQSILDFCECPICSPWYPL